MTANEPNATVQPFQTGTCIGNWHYQTDIFENHGQKSAKQPDAKIADVSMLGESGKVRWAQTAGF